jgi:hypothetical protein
MRSALGEFQARAGDQVGDDSRNQDFARLGLPHDASRRVHRYATNFPASYFDFAGVETRAQMANPLVGRLRQTPRHIEPHGRIRRMLPEFRRQLF